MVLFEHEQTVTDICQSTSWLTVVYTYDPVNMKMIPVPGAGSTEANAHTTDNFKEMQQWFANLMADSFA